MDKKRDPLIIMLVDDQTIIAEAVRRMLCSNPEFEFHYCSDGKAAVEVAKELRPMVILQDLVMPEADGMALLNAYNQEPELQSSPVIILSVKEDPAIKKAAFEQGAHDYMVKLPDPVEFVARVRHHAESCKNARRLSEAMRALRESQRQTQERNIQLEKMNEYKNRLLGVAAHDLRNPLGNILSFSEFLEDAFDNLDPDFQEMVTCIRDLSQSTLKMVEDLLDVSTVESGALRLEQEEADFGSLVAHHVELNSLLAQRKNIQIELEGVPLLPMVNVDVVKITQVINNFIGNAVKYSHPDTTVRVNLALTEEEIRVSVVDEGQGIPESDIPKLFKPFGRASVQPTAGESSTGLGLAICRRIVEGHGGVVGVQSTEGVGSTFYFTVPV